MKTAAQWFEEYGESHQNPINKTIHWICVPPIFVSTIGLIWALPHFDLGHPWLNWATIVVALGLVFYARLSFTLFVGMALISGLSLWISSLLAQSGTQFLVMVCGSVFVVAWIGQFIGHKIEGKKPSFFGITKAF